MEAMRRLEIDVPEELAGWVGAQVAAGRFASASEAVACALALMREEAEQPDDPELEAWLKSVVVPRLRELDENKVRTMTVDEARASLAQRRAERDRAA